MKKLQLKKEVIANLDNQTSKMVKGGTNTTITTAIPSMYPTCYCETLTTQAQGCVDTIGSVCYCPTPTDVQATCPAETHAGKECEKTHDCPQTGISACDACQETAR